MIAERHFSVIASSGELEILEEKRHEFMGCPASDTVDPVPVESRHSVIQCLLNFRGYFLALASSLAFVGSSVCVRKASFFTGGEQSLMRYAIGLAVVLLWACVCHINPLGEPNQRRVLLLRVNSL